MVRNTPWIAVLVIFILGTLIPCASAQDDVATPVPTSITPPTNKVWRINQILKERRRDKPKKPIDYCNGGRFKPCVCTQDVAREMQYRPAVKECGGRAAIILSGKYLSIFSAVVRDSENRDRWPANSDFGGCTPFERDELGLAKCSAFKTQNVIAVSNPRGNARVHCLGASGYSALFSDVRRVTAKISDSANSTNDPLARWCLKGPALPLN